jgi:hypothetical protein
MKKIIIIAVIALVSLALVFSIGGCAQKAAEKMVERAIEQAAEAEGEDVDIDLSEGEINISDEEGNEMSFGGEDIPDDWPSVVPVNRDIDIAFSASQTTDGKKGWSISGLYKGSGEELYNWYKNELSGWDEQSDATLDAGDDGKTYTYQASNGTYLTTVFVTEADGEVNIVLSVTEE